MRYQRIFKLAIGAEVILLIGLAAAISSFSPEKSADLRLYELLGAVLAATITTAGIYGMKELT